MERRSNEAGRFLLCSVRDLEAKRFCLIFPERKGLSGGWNILAEKLREVGVAPFGGLKDPLSLEVLKKENELEPRTFADVAKSKMGRLGDKMGKGGEPSPELEYLKNWAGHAWLLKGKLDIAVMGGGLMLFEFELVSEAERVLARGKRKVLGSVLVLERWHPEVGCFSNGVFANEAWVRVVGLPLHLWNRKVFKLIGDGCGGFIAVDNKTDSMAELQWARCWWCRREVVSGKGYSGQAETGSGSRAECRGGVLVKDGQPKELAGVVEPPCGSSSKGATGFPSESAERGPGAEVTDGEDSLGIRSQGAGKVARLGGLEFGPAAFEFGPIGRPSSIAGLEG
ncbi:hypothetical protein CK203_000494 [Vitis vinifera]|uniref:DUF4283 domain-containing protein n=1 Tax=Vitis vinifera TaxID=29760 RepID=A0A438KPX5_VITVI|nr:hypothetical protein CK203_000494 [Vitis vinifera]